MYKDHSNESVTVVGLTNGLMVYVTYTEKMVTRKEHNG